VKTDALIVQRASNW